MATDTVAWHKRAGSKIWYFFNSLKLTLFVLITLAVVSILGTFIEQNQQIEAYVRSYGMQWTKVIVYLRLYDMYHAPWFSALLILLVLNIIVCTFERFPPKWKAILRHKTDRFDPGLIARLSNNAEFSVNAGVKDVGQRVEKALKSKKFKFMSSESNGDYYFYAWKGVSGRFGSDFTHISLLLILLGSIVGSAIGYKDFKQIYVDGMIKVPQADFALRLDKFWIDYYETGQIRQYNSLLTVLEEGNKEIMTKQIWVNEPLYYKGIRFYQSSYGTAWDRVDTAYIALKKGGKTEADDPVAVKWEELAKLPGSAYSVKAVSYVSDFAYDERTNSVMSVSPEPNNPAVRLEVYKGDKLVSTPWLFLKYPGVFPAIPGVKDDLVFSGYRPLLYSGISINKDPGTNIVWAGTIVMGFGFILAFFVYHRRVWVHVRSTGEGTRIKLGGTINKNQLLFEKEFQHIRDVIENG